MDAKFCHFAVIEPVEKLSIPALDRSRTKLLYTYYLRRIDTTELQVGII